MQCREKTVASKVQDGPGDTHKRVRIAGQIFAEYSEQIYAFIRYHVSDESVVEDLYQDFFVSLAKTKLPSRIKDMKSFLFRAIANDVVSMTRRARRRHERLKIYLQDSRAEDREQEDPCEEMISRERQRALLQYLAEYLRPTEFNALVWRYGRRMGNAEAARELGIAKRSFIRYACSAMRKIRRLNLEGEELLG